jgi:hypothetical protein
VLRPLRESVDGSCTESFPLSTSLETKADLQDGMPLSGAFDTFPDPDTLGAVGAIATFSDIAVGTGGIFKATGQPFTDSDTATEYVNAGVNISVSSVLPAVGGTNTAPVNKIVGVNTLLLSGSASPVPDIVALGATLNNDGIVNIPGATETGVFAVATFNVGVTGTITASADTGGATVPVTILLCETTPATGACKATPTATVARSVATSETPTYGVFVTGGGSVAFSPGVNRVYVRFKDAGGETRGATSVAVRTQ